jgi:hypothetical protein
VDLRVVRVQVLDHHHRRRSVPAADTIRRQSESILVAAHRELAGRVPEICDTIQLLFQPGSPAAYLAALSAEDMWRLLLHLELLLFKGLLADVSYFETSLFMVHTFLLSLSASVQNVSGVEQFPDFFRELVTMCQTNSYSDHSLCLKETQFLFLRFEKALAVYLSGDPGPPSKPSSSNPGPVLQSSSSNPGTVLHSLSAIQSSASQHFSASPGTVLHSLSTNPTSGLKLPSYGM